jgi:hypothetical protein
VSQRQRGVAGPLTEKRRSVLHGGDESGVTRTLCFDTRMLRRSNGFVAAHHRPCRTTANKVG